MMDCGCKDISKTLAAAIILFLSLEYTVGLSFTTEPSSLLVLPSGRAVFKCAADTEEAEIKWMRDGQFIKHNPGQGIQITNSRLTVKPITYHAEIIHSLYSAPYQCVILYKGVSLISQQAKLIVAELNNFAPREDVYIEVIPGNVAVIPCRPPHSVPVAVTEFQFNNITVISRSKGRYFILSSGNLHISNVRKSDGGVYICFVNNPFLGYKIKAFHRVHLRVQSEQRKKEILFTHRPPKSVGAVTGSNITIECSASGYPVPKIVWMKRRGHLPKKRHRQVAGNLIIINVQTEDAGSYSCVATNTANQGVSAVVALSINELPEVKEPSGFVSAKENSDVTLRCSISGSPKPAVTWVHNGNLIRRNTDISIRYDILVLKKVSMEQRGAYQCFVINDLGSTYGTSFLQVGSKKLGIEITEENSEKNSKTSSSNVKKQGNKKRKRKKDRKRGKGKKNKNKNKNKENISTDNADQMVPPTRPEITKLTDHSVMVRWNVPENNGLKIEFFKLQYKDVSEDTKDWKTITEEINRHVKSFEVLDLETGHTYRFRIAAVYSNKDNKVGQNSYKFTLHKDPPMKKPVYGPTIVSAVAISPSAILINWKHEENSEVKVDGFFLRYRSASTAGKYTKMTVLGSNTRSHIIDHLLPNMPYEIKMQSFNMAGTSDFSNIYTDKTKGFENSTNNPEDDNGPDVGHRNVVKITSDTHKSSKLLYTILGIALGVMFIVLIAFIVACSIKQRNERIPENLGQAIHSKYQDTSAHIHEAHHMNGGLLTRSSPLVVNSKSGIRNKYIAAEANPSVNININPMSYDDGEDDGDKSPQLEMIPMNNNEAMMYSRLLQSSDSPELGSPCSDPSEIHPMLASEENSQIQSPNHSTYDGRIVVDGEISLQNTDDECS